MPAVAEVQFKAAGNQQVVTAFKSIGTAAGESTSKIQQNSSAMKSMGQGMKGSVSGIGQVATAFATLSLSIVSTWRAYRDLGDAQIAVDKANLRVKKTTEAIRKSEAEVAKLKKESAKGGLESVAATNKIRLMEQNLDKDRKAHKKTDLQLQVQQDAINLAKKEGLPASKKLMDAENKLALQKEQLGVQTDVAAEAQERFNDIQQDFYLSILPLGLSSIASLTTAFRGLGGVLKGGGGLIGGLGPIGLILGGITLAIIAFKTNFLGLRDAVGGVITWLKDRFGVWKQTIEDVFNLIRGGKWGEAFNMIKEAAAKFWEDLKKSVPLFGEIDSLIQKIRGGQWKGAFLQIWKAASDAWATIKKNIPILGKVEDAVRAISEGKWGEAFQKIADTAIEIFNNTLGKGIEWIFGKNWKAGFDAKIAEITAEASVNNRSIPVQVGIEINSWIKDVTGVDVAKWFKDHPLTAGVLPLALGGITLSIEDPKFQEALKKGAEIILGALGTALKTAIKTLDPYLAEVVKALNFNTAITAAKDAIINAGKAIWIHIFNGIRDGFTTQDWGQLFAKFPAAVDTAWRENAPEVQKSIFENYKSSWLAAITGMDKMEFPVAPKVVQDAPIIIQKGIQTGANTSGGKRQPYTVPVAPDTSKMPSQLASQLTKVIPKDTKLPVSADTTQALKLAKQAQARIDDMRATINVGANFIGFGHSAGLDIPGMQHGVQTTVKRPTMFIAGEGGRPEDVTVRPRGSVQRGGGSGGGSSSTHITVSFEPQEFMQFVRYRINDNQGVVK